MSTHERAPVQESIRAAMLIAKTVIETFSRMKVLVSRCMEMGVKLVLLVSAAGSALTRFRVSSSGKPIKVGVHF